MTAHVNWVVGERKYASFHRVLPPTPREEALAAFAKFDAELMAMFDREDEFEHALRHACAMRTPEAETEAEAAAKVATEATLHAWRVTKPLR